MSVSKTTYRLGLYAWGKDLDPDLLTSRIGLVPTTTGRTGDRETSSSGREWRVKIGV